MDIEYYELYANEQDAKYHENMLATVVEFDYLKTIVKWAGHTTSIVIHKNLENFKNVSLTGDRVLLRLSFEPDYKYHNPKTFTLQETMEEHTKK